MGVENRCKETQRLAETPPLLCMWQEECKGCISASDVHGPRDAVVSTEVTQREAGNTRGSISRSMCLLLEVEWKADFIFGQFALHPSRIV